MTIVDFWTSRNPALQSRVPFRVFVNGKRPGHGVWFLSVLGWGVASFWLCGPDGCGLLFDRKRRRIVTVLRFGRVTIVPGPD